MRLILINNDPIIQLRKISRILYMFILLVRLYPTVRCTRRGLTKKIYAYVYIFRKAPSRTWRVREGALRKIYAYVYIFRKAPSRTWRVREGALRKIYAYVYIFRKAPSRTWRVREGALRARMCALVTFKFLRVTN